MSYTHTTNIHTHTAAGLKLTTVYILQTFYTHTTFYTHATYVLQTAHKVYTHTTYLLQTAHKVYTHTPEDLFFFATFFFLFCLFFKQ